MAPKQLINKSEIWDGEMRAVRMDHKNFLLIHLDGEVYVYQNRCPHKGVELHKGKLQNGVLTCPTHHWQFDAKSGKGVNPKQACLKPFPVKIFDDDSIWVDYE